MTNQTAEHSMRPEEPQKKGAGKREQPVAPPNNAASGQADPHSYLGRAPGGTSAPKDAQPEDKVGDTG
jgi:hypothetical protein